MMSLLSVTVKKARYIGTQASQFNTYVTLKLQNVKSTTVTVKGATPCWEQDFLFETNNLNTGLLIEVWSKGMIWDRAMGYTWIPLQSVQYSNEEGNGQLQSLEAELVMRDGEVVGTKNPTGHFLLVDCRFELPFDPENIEASDLQRKLEMLNNIMDQEARMEQARRQMQYFGHSGYSEDSDYTSDLNYPVGQHANSSASQYRSVAHQIHTPQRSLETSRENSYERDDVPNSFHQQLPATQLTHEMHINQGIRRHHHQNYGTGMEDYCYTNSAAHYVRHQEYNENNSDFDPLFYNSRPRNKPDCSSQETWASCETSFCNQSVDSDVGYSFTDVDYYPNQYTKKNRRPSLERQNTLYDDSTLYGDSTYYPNDNAVTEINNMEINQVVPFNQNQSCEEYFDSLSEPFHEKRFGQDAEDRQWDSGGVCPSPTMNSCITKKLPSIPIIHSKRRFSITQLDELYEQQRSTPTFRRKMPQVPSFQRGPSRQSSINDGHITPDNIKTHRGASLPPTPTKTKKLPQIQQFVQQNLFNSLPPTPGRQLPKPRLSQRNNRMKRTTSYDNDNGTSDYDYVRSGAISAREKYNEDYNYAYQSIDDNLQNQIGGGVVGKSNAPSLQYQSQSFDNDSYYNAQEDFQLEYDYPQQNQDDNLIEEKPQPSKQQQTSKSSNIINDFKDTFGTTILSINSSLSAFKSKTMAQVAPSSTMQYYNATLPEQRDQSHPKAIPTTIVQVHNNKPRGVLKQQDSILDLNYLNRATPTVLQHQPLSNQDSIYLEAQESIESYIEEDEDEMLLEDRDIHNNAKIGNHESPPSVIINDNYTSDDVVSLRRGSSQVTIVDPYHPHHDAFAATRRSSTVDQRRASNDSGFNLHQDHNVLVNGRKASIEQQRYLNEDLECNDNILENGQSVLLKDELDDMVSEPEKKSVLFEVSEEEEKKIKELQEEEEKQQQRPQITAQQRWLWAYNKIIMQLNVSFFYYLFKKNMYIIC